jgi:hypothetical protein
VAKAHEAIEKTVVFTINGVQIETVEEFKYLGQIVTREDNDKVAVKWNLARAKKKWASMRTISDHRWSRFENNCNFLSNSGN